MSSPSSTERALSCHEVVELITDYLEDALAPDVRARVDEHLAVCDGCARYLDQMRETIRLTGMLTEEQVTQEQKASLVEAFRSWAGR